MKKIITVCVVMLVLSACGVRGTLHHPDEPVERKPIFKG